VKPQIIVLHSEPILPGSPEWLEKYRFVPRTVEQTEQTAQDAFLEAMHTLAAEQRDTSTHAVVDGRIVRRKRAS
jgi:hypothetical protein